MVSESPGSFVISDALMVTEAVSPAAIVAEVAEIVKVSLEAVGVAEEGPEPNKPIPNAATVKSAMRLNVSFDIYFLSLVDPENFPRSAWQRSAFFAM